MQDQPGQPPERRCPRCGADTGEGARFCQRCGFALSEDRAVAYTGRDQPHPVSFDVEYPESVSRLTTFFRLILAIPQLIVVYLLLSALSFISIMAWFAILFTGRYPQGLLDFSRGAVRWSANVSAYTALFRDEYPPWSWEPGAYPLTLEIPRSEQQSRWRLFIRYFAIFPNQVVFWFVQFAWTATGIVAWFAILFTGRYPRGLFNFGVGALRWNIRQQTYLYLLRDEYPPYSTAADARPGNEVVSAIIGFPLFVGYMAVIIALQLLPFFSLLGNDTETVHVTAPLSSPALEAEAPSGEAYGVRVTLLGYADNVPQPEDVESIEGFRFVSFRVEAEKDGSFPAFYSDFMLRLEDCFGNRYSPETTNGGSEFEMFWTGGESEGSPVFQIPVVSEPCELIFQPGLGKVEFVFDGGA